MGEFNRFGFEWSKYRKILPLYETQFKKWVAPLSEEDFRGKRVLDAGCGTGRNSHWSLTYGASEVEAFDVDPRTVAVAKENLKSWTNCVVTEASIFDITYDNEFDIVFSIGVIHHLPDPKKAVERLVSAAKPGGIVLIWVYGKDGYAGLKGAINAVRKVTCRIPLGILNVVVYPWSLLFYAYIRYLPHKHPYKVQFKQANFWHLHSIVFDQLLPEIANYWTDEEAKSLFDGLQVENVVAHSVNMGSWTVMAKKAPVIPSAT